MLAAADLFIDRAKCLLKIQELLDPVQLPL
jgi:hypothetical protein